jgi:ubiquinone/menaquinone biosynthesis C-methylase UbiE
VSGQSAAWQRFERDAAGYEGWYITPRGRRADRAERALLERLLAPFATARSALEVGCGTGHFMQWLAASVPHVVGLDRAPAMLSAARRRLAGRPLVLGDAHELPFRDGAVDLTVFVTTLEFLEDPARALAEAVRVSCRGVLVVALNRWSLGGLSRRWGPQARRPLLGHARDLSLTSLRALTVAAAGERLGHLRWASALFPDGLAGVVARVPVGSVVGVAVTLAHD